MTKIHNKGKTAYQRLWAELSIRCRKLKSNISRWGQQLSGGRNGDGQTQFIKVQLYEELQTSDFYNDRCIYIQHVGAQQSGTRSRIFSVCRSHVTAALCRQTETITALCAYWSTAHDWGKHYKRKKKIIIKEQKHVGACVGTLWGILLSVFITGWDSAVCWGWWRVCSSVQSFTVKFPLQTV